jgi:hypothetical protein
VLSEANTKLAAMSAKDTEIEQMEVRGYGKQELSDIELTEGKRSKKAILLRPQPSNDPNDPLVSLTR